MSGVTRRTGPESLDPESLAEALALIEHLRRALATRSIIGQAHGIVMERYGLDEGAAFALLKRVSSANEVKVSHLSEQIIAGVPVRGLDPPPPRSGG
jgi:AmiR/NasT family two-component response regulator